MIPAVKLLQPLSFGFGVEVWAGLLGDHKVVVRRYFGPALDQRYTLLPDAAAIMRLDHPNLQRMLWTGNDEDGTLVQLSDWVDGVSLKSRMRAPDRLEMTFNEFRTMLRDGLAALAYLHGQPSRPLVHGDISPGNLVLTETMEEPGLKLTMIDIKCPGSRRGGLTRLLRQHEPYPIVGTLPYMSDDVLTGEPVDPAAEVWSLGVAMLAAAIGCTPWADADSPDAMLARRRESPPEAMLERLPRDILRDRRLPGIIEKMVAANLYDRPSAKEALEEISAS
jgi:serine/threonine protein kinase